MNDWGGARWSVVVLALFLSVSLGCAKKQVVKSTEAEGAPGAGTQGGIVTETVKPETPPEQTPTAMAATPAEAATMEQPSTFEDIHFDFDKAFIREDAKPILAKVADAMKAKASASLRIEGYCDERGTAEYNMALGERRATAAMKYLVSLGVPAGSLSTISFGEEKPLDPGHNEEAWAKNRRAHFVMK